MHTSTHWKLLPTTSLCHRCYEPNSCTSGITTFYFPHQINRYLPTARPVTFPMPTSANKPQVSFRLKGHFYCRFYVFLSHLTGVKLYCCVHCLPIFFQHVTNRVFECCVPDSTVLITPVVFIVWFHTVQWFPGTPVSHHSRTDCICLNMLILIVSSKILIQ